VPIDPQIFRDLDAEWLMAEPLPPLLDRLVYMGILLAPSQQIYSVKFPKVIQASYATFRAQLLWRPWNKHLVRKELARDRRRLRLEHYLLLEHWLGAPTTIPSMVDRVNCMVDAATELLLLDGLTLPDPEPSRRPRRRRAP